MLPKLSYVLLSHNREKYIRAAIESAFAQDYAGELEIIISDDCSTDRSYEIIKECAAAYQGPHKVIVTQTPQNGHLARHTNHAFQFVSSDWMVRADDDDYSSIDRCTLIGEAIAAHPDCTYVVTGVKKFTDVEDAAIRAESLRPSRQQDTHYRIANVRQGYEAVSGRNPIKYSYKAWHRSVYDQFGNLHPEGYYVDDLCCYNRANLLGYGVYVENAVNVMMRMGSENMSRGGDDNSRGYEAIIRLERFNDKYYNITWQPMQEDIAAYEKYLSTCEDAAQCAPFMQSLQKDMMQRRDYKDYWRRGMFYRLGVKKRQKLRGLFSWLRLLPMPIFARCLTLYRRIKGTPKK